MSDKLKPLGNSTKLVVGLDLALNWFPLDLDLTFNKDRLDPYLEFVYEHLDIDVGLNTVNLCTYFQMRVI